MIIGRPSSKLGVIRIEIRIWDPDNWFSWITGRILIVGKYSQSFIAVVVHIYIQLIPTMTCARVDEWYIWESREMEIKGSILGDKDNFSILYFVTVLIRGTIIKFRGHRGFNPKSSSPDSPVCTTAVHLHNLPREMVVYKSVWTQWHKRDQRSEISTTGLRSRISEGPRAFAGSALSECHFLVCFYLAFVKNDIQLKS